MNITLLENHWYDATFSPSTRFGRDEDGEAVEMDAGPARESSDGGGSSRLGAALAPVLLAAGAAAGVVAARQFRARRAERAAELRQVEVDAVGYANAIAE